jgi:hypothetical protein
MSVLPDPPRDDVDANGRYVHPYVRDPEPDPSAPGYILSSGEKFTQEDRSRESRLAFHAIEELLGHLTPLGLTYLTQAIVHRLYTPTLADEYKDIGVTPEELDPRGELLPFEELHSTRLRTIHAAVEEMIATCARCGRHDGVDGLQPGAYVNTDTGDALNVRRVTDTNVYAVAQVDHGAREVSRVYQRDWFEQHFVPAASVHVLAVDPAGPGSQSDVDPITTVSRARARDAGEEASG